MEWQLWSWASRIAAWGEKRIWGICDTQRTLPCWKYCCVVICRGEQKAPENATHPRNRRKLTVWKIRFFGCVAFSGAFFFPSKRASKSTRKRNTPENADFRNGQSSAVSSFLRFRVCCVFGCSLAPAKIYYHPCEFSPGKQGVSETLP